MFSLILVLVACLDSSATSWLYQYIKCVGGRGGGGRRIWDMSIVNTMASTLSQFQLREAGDTVQSDNAFVKWVVCVNL